MLKQVIPLSSDQLALIEPARKAVKDAEDKLNAIIQELVKPHERKGWPWSVRVDGGFILISRHD